MLFRSLRSASRRKSMAVRALSFAGLLLVASLAWVAPLFAHEGHDQEPPPSTVGTTGKPRLAVQSEAYQVVAILDGQQLTIYLDRFTDNSPVTDANVSVAIN